MSVCVFPGDLERLKMDAYCNQKMINEKPYDDKAFLQKYREAESALSQIPKTVDDMHYCGVVTGDLLGELRCCKDVGLANVRLSETLHMIENVLFL